jgi:regulator of protease activity HflC (stomatin/prohibitin superfamily)
MGSAFLSGILLALGALAAYLGSSSIFELLTVVIPGVMVLIGAETVLHFLLGIYRPRRPGEMPRPAFDSRLLGWLTSPESIARIISETINYQFGIEVSRSWFYRLLSRAITPLVAFSLAMLVAISSIVVVEPQETAIITCFGAPVGGPVGPGLHFKWPWPIGAADKQPVGRVLTLELGSKQEGFTIDPKTFVLWTNPHAGKEEYLVTAPSSIPEPGLAGPATQPSANPAAGKATGWSLIGAQINVQYRVADMAAYVRCARDPQKLLHDLAEAEINRYFVTKDIDTLLLENRVAAGALMQRLIQAACENPQTHTGVVVLAVDLSGLHPPSESDVALAFLKQIAAGQKAKSAIDQSRKKAIQVLGGVAGTPEQAQKLYQAALEDQGKQTGQTPELLTGAQGEVGKIISAARAQRWQKSLGERAAASMFQAQLRQYQVAPEYFLAAQYADFIASLPADARKYIVDVDPATKPVWQIDLNDEMTPLSNLLPPGR